MRIIGSKQLKLSTVCFDALKTSKPVWLLPSVSVFSLHRYFTHDVFYMRASKCGEAVRKSGTAETACFLSSGENLRSRRIFLQFGQTAFFLHQRRSQVSVCLEIGGDGTAGGSGSEATLRTMWTSDQRHPRSICHLVASQHLARPPQHIWARHISKKTPLWELCWFTRDTKNVIGSTWPASTPPPPPRRRKRRGARAERPLAVATRSELMASARTPSKCPDLRNSLRSRGPKTGAPRKRYIGM